MGGRDRGRLAVGDFRGVSYRGELLRGYGLRLPSDEHTEMAAALPERLCSTISTSCAMTRCRTRTSLALQVLATCTSRLRRCGAVMNVPAPTCLACSVSGQVSNLESSPTPIRTNNANCRYCSSASFTQRNERKACRPPTLSFAS